MPKIKQGRINKAGTFSYDLICFIRTSENLNNKFKA